MGASFSCHLLCVCVCGFSCAGQLFATLWTAASQDPQSADSPGKNIVVGYHALFQGIFPNQGSNLSLLCLLYCQLSSLPLAPPRKPILWYHSKEDWVRSWCRESSSQRVQPLLTGFERLCHPEYHIPPPDVPQDRFASLKHHRKALGKNPAWSEWYM